MKDSDEHRSSIGKMTAENQKLHTTIRNLEKDITDLKSEIKNRDDTIADKVSMSQNLLLLSSMTKQVAEAPQLSVLILPKQASVFVKRTYFRLVW